MARAAATCYYLFVLLALVQCVHGEEEVKSDGDAKKEAEAEVKPATRCLELGDKTFNKHMVEEGPLFVKFYLPTCKHCQMIKPIWEELADKINPKDGEKIQTDTPAKIVCLNCDENPRTCKQVGLSGFPKLKLMGVIPGEKGYEAVVVEYKGKRTLAPMEKYIRGVKYVQEEKMKQEQKEADEAKFREKQWMALEPPLEKEAAEWNNGGGELKDVTWKNIDGFIDSGSAEDGNHFVLMLNNNAFDRSNYRGAWEEAANKVKHLDGVTFGTLNCEGGMARVCFNHKKVLMPFRFDIFPQMVIYDKNNPEGRVVDKSHQKTKAADLFKVLNDDTLDGRINNHGISQADVDEL